MNSLKTWMITSIWLLVAGTVFVSTGCERLIQRAQSPDSFALPLRDEKAPQDEGTHYIGESCGIYGLNYAKVEGVGIAVELQETGSNPKPGGQRDYLKRQLESESADISVEDLLASSNTELILLKGLIPPGARKGDRFDLEVGTLGNTEATSLEGGVVLETDLKPMEKLGRTVKQGHVNAQAKGRVLVDGVFETRNDQPNQLHGTILGGGVVLEDRKLGLSIKSGYADGEAFTPKTTTMIARAINSRFTHADRSGRYGAAEPKTDRFVEVVVPKSHRQNVGRFLQVIINIAHSESASHRLMRMEQLSKDIFNTELAAETALRLEALGNDGVPILKRALGSDNLEVKFQAAQALAYMGETDGIDHLKMVARSEPAFRWHALTALSVVKAVQASEALTELMHVDSAETRYGAFRAMRHRSDSEPLVHGDWIGDFHLHLIPSQTSSPLIHFSRRERPEVVIFGNSQTINDDFLYVQSGTTIRANGDSTIRITRYSPDGKKVKTCSNRVSDLTATLARLGFGYGDLLKIFRSAKESGTLDSRLAVDAVPKLGRIYVPGNAGSMDTARMDREGTGKPTTINGKNSPTMDVEDHPNAHTEQTPSLPKTFTLGRMREWIKK